MFNFPCRLFIRLSYHSDCRRCSIISSTLCTGKLQLILISFWLSF